MMDAIPTNGTVQPVFYVVIVGKNDVPVFEQQYTKPIDDDKARQGTTPPLPSKYLQQFIAFASLDLVQERIWKSHSLYLGKVDQSHLMKVHALVGIKSTVRFLVVHDCSTMTESVDSTCASFLAVLHEIYAKFALNPLYAHHTPIRCPAFERMVAAAVQRYLYRL